MGDRPKVHIFLGAPPPSSGPTSSPEAGTEAVWRHLELTWRDGQLRPVRADDAGNEPGAAERTDQGLDPRTDPPGPSLQIQDDPTTSESDWTAETVQGPEGPAGEFSSEEESLNKDQASVHEYLDDCFPVGLPEPERPGPGNGPKPEHTHGPGPERPRPGPGPETERHGLGPKPEHIHGPGPEPERPGPGPGPEPEPEPERPGPGPGPGPEPERHGTGPGPGSVHPLSEQTHFLSTWTLSQALVLRGRHIVQSASSPQKTPPSSSTPELFSPAAPSLEASVELFRSRCPTPRVEEGGVVLQATVDGILCSQESTTSPAESPRRKKTRVCGESRTEAATRLHATTTLLAQCDKSGVCYSVLVAVVHPCHLKEVQVRSGLSAGTSVPLASIVVTDQSGVEMKVVLWRRAAFWASTVSPGDVLLITALRVSEDRWRGETLLQTTFSSKLLNLGPTAASTCPPPESQQVDARSLSSLCVFLRERRPLLVSLSHRRPQDLSRLPYATLRSLRVNTLVHALLRVTHTHVGSAWRSEAESHWRSAIQVKVVLTVEQTDGYQGEVMLWGSAVKWLPRLRGDSASFWDFRVLLVRDGLTSDLPELHSTPWSSVHPVDPTDRRLRDVQRRRHVQRGTSVELDLDTLLSQKFSGDVELRVQVISFHFQDVPLSQNAPQPVLDSGTSLDGVLAALSGDVTYTGCSRCSAELDTDANGIYCPCYPCLPHRALRRYYRRGVLTVSGRSFRQVCVQVPPVPLQQILKVPPDKLQRSSAPGSEVKLIQVAAERIQTLLSLPKKTFIISVRSHFLCDENSVPIDQEFTLLDLQFPDTNFSLNL